MGTVIATRAAERYKSDQRRQWDAAAPEVRTWWPAFERFMAPVTHAIVAHSGLRPGASVVDVASGFGEPALTVARLVGPQGRVVATDLSPAMLAVAAQRAAAAGLTNVELALMDAEEPTLAEGRYDAGVCRLGLMFLPDLGGALERLGALLAPGGRFAAAVWGSPEANTWLTLARRTLVEFLELPPPPPGPPGPFGLAGPGLLDAAFSEAGFDDVRRTRVRLRCAWPSPAAYAAFHRASPMRRLAAGEEPARAAEAWAEVATAAARAWGDGPLRLGGEVLVVSGRRPSPFGPNRKGEEVSAMKQDSAPPAVAALRLAQLPTVRPH